MNILVTGANGQLGNIVQDLSKLHTNNNYYFTDVDVLDITNSEAVDQYVIDHNVDTIINCAAFTNVDAAEENVDIAYKVNAVAPRILAEVSKEHNCKLIHISTDYVFRGDGNSPYKETDEPNPNTVYGRTKLEGEKYIMNINPENSIIIRTAWLYSEYGKNFMKTMITLGRNKSELKVVNDQCGTPTYARDLGEAIFTILEYEKWVPGIYHFTNEGITNWYDFTLEIHYNAKVNYDMKFGSTEQSHHCEVLPIKTSEYQYKTPRPLYSVLDKTKIKETFGISIRDWDEALKDAEERYEIKSDYDDLLKGTEYSGKRYDVEGDWKHLKPGYASPIFHFESGEIIAFDKFGKLVKLN